MSEHPAAKPVKAKPTKRRTSGGRTPRGWQRISFDEFYSRRAKCLRRDNWRDLENVKLYCPCLRQLMCISTIPWMGRYYVERKEKR